MFSGRKVNQSFFSKMSSSPLPNTHLEKLDEDHLYHIGYAKNEELDKVFAGVKVRHAPIRKRAPRGYVCA